MSLVGTRPILQDELQKYELHHRARIAIKPGITGMWQVSGRSDITDFELPLFSQTALAAMQKMQVPQHECAPHHIFQMHCKKLQKKKNSQLQALFFQ